LYWGLENDAESEKYMRFAVDRIRDLSEPTHPRLVSDLAELENTLRMQNKHEEVQRLRTEYADVYAALEPWYLRGELVEEID
jgi:hypothetical protein